MGCGGFLACAGFGSGEGEVPGRLTSTKEASRTWEHSSVRRVELVPRQRVSLVSPTPMHLARSRRDGTSCISEHAPASRADSLRALAPARVSMQHAGAPHYQGPGGQPPTPEWPRRVRPPCYPPPAQGSACLGAHIDDARRGLAHQSTVAPNPNTDPDPDPNPSPRAPEHGGALQLELREVRVAPQQRDELRHE